MNASSVFSATAKAGLNISQADLLALAASDPTAYYALKEEVAKEVTNLDAARQRFAEDSAQAQAALTALQGAEEALTAGQAALVADQAQVQSTREQLAARALDLEQSSAALLEAQNALKQAQEQLASERNAFENEKTVHAATAQNALKDTAERQAYLDNLSADLSFQKATLELKVTAWKASKEQFINQLREWSI